MSSTARAPGFIAGETILPYAALKVSTAADRTVLNATAQTDVIIGFADGSIRDPVADTTNHATAGETVRMQEGDVQLCQVKASATVTRGNFVAGDTAGKVTTPAGSSGAASVNWLATVSGTDTELIEVVRVAGGTKTY